MDELLEHLRLENFEKELWQGSLSMCFSAFARYWKLVVPMEMPVFGMEHVLANHSLQPVELCIEPQIAAAAALLQAELILEDPAEKSV